MARQMQTEEARRDLALKMTAAGTQIRERYGPQIGWPELLRLLEDRACAPYPCEIQFDSGPLLPGEFAHPVPKGKAPEEGYIIYVHPAYASQLGRVPYLVLHQLAGINYGETTSADDAETFGSLALGLSKEEYYRALCELSGQLGGDELV